MIGISILNKYQTILIFLLEALVIKKWMSLWLKKEIRNKFNLKPNWKFWAKNISSFQV
jgi:hypothetical protein